MNGLTEPEQISVCRAMCERRDLPRPLFDGVRPRRVIIVRWCGENAK